MRTGLVSRGWFLQGLVSSGAGFFRGWFLQGLVSSGANGPGSRSAGQISPVSEKAGHSTLKADNEKHLAAMTFISLLR
jgi:hypothetical protein